MDIGSLLGAKNTPGAKVYKAFPKRVLFLVLVPCV